MKAKLGGRTWAALLTFGLFGIGYLVDFIKIICGKFTDKDGNAIRREKK